MLEVENINVFYGVYQAIHDVSLRVSEGQLVSIFGPNGHGKSTLLKTICGLMKPASGVIRFQGREIQGLLSHKLVEMGVVLISEERHLFPEMTVMENLLLGAYAKPARKKEAENLEFVFSMLRLEWCAEVQRGPRARRPPRRRYLCPLRQTAAVRTIRSRVVCSVQGVRTA